MKPKVFVVMPAYNAEKTLLKTYYEIPKSIVDTIILVDDGSRDNTAAIAKKLGLKTFIHRKNLGYGANQKTCYKIALEMGADIIVMLHPDYQYDSRAIKDLILPIKEKRADIMLSSRITTAQNVLRSGMPLYKYIGNRILTTLENIVLGHALSEYHTGFRAFHRNVLQQVPFDRFSNDFVFDQEILISAIWADFKVKEISVPARYAQDSSVIGAGKSIKYGLEIILALFKYTLSLSGIYHSKIFSKERS